MFAGIVTKSLYVLVLVLALVAATPSATLVNLATQVKGILAVANGGTGVSSAQGNGTKVQLSTGSTTTNDCVKYDANGNAVDSGSACSGGGAPTTSQYLLNAPDGTLTNSRVLLLPDTPPASANALDDEFNGSSVSVQWSWVNQGTATSQEGSGWLGMKKPNAGAQSNSLYCEASPATPWEFTAKVALTVNYAAGTGITGIAMRESGTSKIISIEMYQAGIEVVEWTNPTTVSAATFSGAVATPPRMMYFKIKNDGTNLNFSESTDGVNFLQVWTETKTHFFTTGPDQVCFHVNPLSADVYGGFDWFRRTL